jgi:hypothetical protein
MPTCRYRRCDAVLDSAAAYCTSAHRSAEHRAVVADKTAATTTRRATALVAVRCMTSAALVGDDELVLKMAADLSVLLKP